MNLNFIFQLFFFLFLNDSSRTDSSRFCSKYLTRTTTPTLALSGGAGGLYPIGLKSIQNTPFLALLRPIFALKTKRALPNGIGDENWSRIWCNFDQKKLGFNLAEDFFFGDHLNLDRITVSILVKTFFLETTNIWTQKPTQSDWRPTKIWVKIV